MVMSPVWQRTTTREYRATQLLNRHLKLSFAKNKISVDFFSSIRLYQLRNKYPNHPKIPLSWTRSSAWVTRLEHTKDVEDKVKQPEGRPSRGLGPKSTWNFYSNIFLKLFIVYFMFNSFRGTSWNVVVKILGFWGKSSSWQNMFQPLQRCRPA